jgi:large subunit ribosomal protein L10
MVQPTPKKMSREDKEELVERFKGHLEDYTVVGILDMHNLPAKQLQDIKKDMKEFAMVRMSRKTLMDLSIDQADREGVEQLKENEATQPAFIFSEKDPFQLYSLIQANKTSAAAQGGEEAPADIEVQEGDTGIGPGPMLGKLQQAGLNVQVQDGSIAVMDSAVIIEQGETITDEDAEILNELGIEPLEIGLDLKVAFAQGELFTREELDIDVDQYRKDVEAAVSTAFNLAVNAGVVNETTAPALVKEAVRKARNMAVGEGVPEEETIEDSISYAASNARGVDSQAETESVNLEDESEEVEADDKEPEESEEAEPEDSNDE